MKAKFTLILLISLLTSVASMAVQAEDRDPLPKPGVGNQVKETTLDNVGKTFKNWGAYVSEFFAKLSDSGKEEFLKAEKTLRDKIQDARASERNEKGADDHSRIDRPDRIDRPERPERPERPFATPGH